AAGRCGTGPSPFPLCPGTLGGNAQRAFPGGRLPKAVPLESGKRPVQGTGFKRTHLTTGCVRKSMSFSKLIRALTIRRNPPLLRAAFCPRSQTPVWERAAFPNRSLGTRGRGTSGEQEFGNEGTIPNRSLGTRAEGHRLRITGMPARNRV